VGKTGWIETKRDKEKYARFERPSKGKRGLPLLSRTSAIPSYIIPLLAPLPSIPDP
jgi:hypothetical protein